MKFVVTMKCPDALYDAVVEAAQGNIEGLESVNEAVRKHVAEQRKEAALQACRKWFLWDEYLRVEVDMDAGTCVVSPSNTV